MKIGYIKTMGWLFLCSAALLCSCDMNDDHSESRHYQLTVKAIDPDYEGIANNVALYFFNGNRQLEKIVPCALDKESDIIGDFKEYTVIGLGSSMQLPTIALGTTIDQAQIVLSETPLTNNIAADSLGDIFHGRIDLKADCSDVNEIVWIRRKVAALTIITRNIQSELNTTDEDFSYAVKHTSGTLDFEGKLKGDKVSYHPKSNINPINKNLVAPMFYTFPLQDEDEFSIDIYKGKNLINTYSTDKDEKQMLLKEGKHTVVLIDFKGTTGDGFLDVTCTLKDWKDDNISEGFN